MAQKVGLEKACQIGKGEVSCNACQHYWTVWVLLSPKTHISKTRFHMQNHLKKAIPFKLLGEDTAAIRVSNLSENTQEADLQELFKPFGHIARIYLAKDKITGQCKVR